MIAVMDSRVAVVVLSSLLLLFLSSQQQEKARDRVAAAALPTMQPQNQSVADNKLKSDLSPAPIERELAQVDERLQVQEALGQKLRADLRELENNWAFSSFDDEQLWQRFLAWWQEKSAVSLASLTTLMDEHGYLHWSWPQVFHEQVEFTSATVDEALVTAQLQLGDDSAGKLVIPAGSQQVSYRFAQPRRLPPLVFLTQESGSPVVPVMLQTVSESGFVLSLPQAVDYPVVINWLAMETS